MQNYSYRELQLEESRLVIGWTGLVTPECGERSPRCDNGSHDA